MIKLYKKVNGVLRYHEAWENEGTITEHWGVVGERGDSREHTMPKRTSESKALREVLRAALNDGYAELDADELKILLIEYPVDGMGTSGDLDKRHALEERMSTATRVIASDLKDTEFENYSRIYEEE